MRLAELVGVTIFGSLDGLRGAAFPVCVPGGYIKVMNACAFIYVQRGDRAKLRINIYLYIFFGRMVYFFYMDV